MLLLVSLWRLGVCALMRSARKVSRVIRRTLGRACSREHANAKCRMQNAEKRRSQILHFAFCILHFRSSERNVPMLLRRVLVALVAQHGECGDQLAAGEARL